MATASSASADWRPAGEADGLILERPGAVAVIQTADCLPLFFFNDARSRGGVIHVGWRGLQQGIEERLVARLGGDLGSFSFFPGPGHRKQMLRGGGGTAAPFRRPRPMPGRSSVPTRRRQVRHGPQGRPEAVAGAPWASLPGASRTAGFAPFARDGRFPSYRRDGKTGRRIFNFLLLKNGAAPVADKP